jgi:hypothetical protein
MFKLNVKKTLAKLLALSSRQGTRSYSYGSSSMTDVSQSADAYVNIMSISLPAGTWIVSCRARFVPSASSNHYSTVGFSSTSKDTIWFDRRYGQATYNLQHSFTCVALPSTTTTYYLIGSANVAGSWYRKNGAACAIDAIRIK